MSSAGEPATVWPLFPATVLILLGMLLFGFTAVSPLGALSWIVSYWPVVLVLVGGWLVFREYLPQPARQPVAMLGGLGLLAYGVLAAASTVAAGGAFVASGFAPGFGGTPYTDTISLEQPLAGWTKPSGSRIRTVARRSGPRPSTTVHVEATRHFSAPDHPPEVKLVPRDQGLAWRSTTSGRHVHSADPIGSISTSSCQPSARVDARGSSGNVDIDGRAAR